MTDKRRKIDLAVLISALVILMIGHTLFLWQVDHPDALYFDEVHYVPAALALLDGQPGVNPEHPPFAKFLIAAGISLFGDNALGWRYPSVVFGSLSLVGLYLWAIALFGEQRPAWFTTAVTALNQVLYVQSRIAMLDVFALAFMIWGMAAFTASWRRHLPERLLILAAGICFGLSAACKWSGVLALGLVIAIVVMVKASQQALVPWPNMRGRDWLLSLLVAPVAAYYAAWLVASPTAVWPMDFLAAQVQIWTAHTALTGTHPYASAWYTWPWIVRPVWYFFDGTKWDTDDARAASVVYLGNPLVLWGGFAAVLACAASWIRTRRFEAFIVASVFAGFWLSWAIIPRQLAFAYYYLPAAMTLGPALAYVFYRTWLSRFAWARYAFLTAAAGLFIYFLPLSDAGIPFSEPAFDRSIWFETWR